jgi:poly-gamma-glutamate capsule biosynthesis protein CapA/YwtB (metallophosphatase superfamily)
MSALPGDLFPGSYSFEPRSAGDHQWSLLAVGDIMTYTPIQRTAWMHRDDPGETSGGYDWIFRPLQRLVANADLAVGNLEFPVAQSAPPSGRTPFNGDPLYLDALKKVGFDILFTANNHMLDQGIRGSEETIEALQSRGIMTLGTSRVGQKREELLVVELEKEKKIRLAFLNYTKGLNDMSRLVNFKYILWGRNINYALFKENERLAKELFRYFARIFFPSALIVDSRAFVKHVAGRIRQARADGADYVVVFLHWGESGHHLPSAGQRELALELCRAGADAIIGAGPHVIQPFELVDAQGNAVSGDRVAERHECFVAYSLGNLISRPSLGLTSYGMALEMTIAEDAMGFYLQRVRPYIVKSEALPGDAAELSDHATDCPAMELRLADLGEFVELLA